MTYQDVSERWSRKVIYLLLFIIIDFFTFVVRVIYIDISSSFLFSSFNKLSHLPRHSKGWLKRPLFSLKVHDKTSFPLLKWSSSLCSLISLNLILQVMNLIGDVKGKVAVMVDDMIDTAGAFVLKSWEDTVNYIFSLLCFCYSSYFMSHDTITEVTIHGIEKLYHYG